MAFQVEHDVPIPKLVARTKYPWLEMSVGDSILVPLDGEGLGKIHTRVRSSADRAGVKIAGRSEGDSIRFWRTA